MQEEKSQKQLMPENVLNYTKKFEDVKTLHPKIKEILIHNKIVLDSLRTSHEQSLRTRDYHKSRIDDDLRENREIYSDLPILESELPNFLRSEKNLLTLKQQEISILVKMILDVVEETNNIKERVIIKPVNEQKGESKGNLMDEQEKVGFENKIKEYLIIMRDTGRKSEFETCRKKIEKLTETEEQTILVNNLSTELLGKTIKEARYLQYFKKKGKNG